ncbi:MAG: hypothetical protein CMN01_00005 [Rickettsiales bacterium]|nr:hypothetical protein [Rickettsiales bacterium]
MKNDGFFYFPNNRFSIKNYNNGKSKINSVVDSESIIIDFNKKKVIITYINSILLRYMIFG